MVDKQPTQEQVKEFWEWCGFKLSVKVVVSGDGPERIYYEAIYPDGTKRLRPLIDLNNLFKYAMAKLDQSRYYKALSSIFLKNDDPALALFWALWQVKEVKNGRKDNIS